MIVGKSGNSLIIESSAGAQYSRNTAHMTKYMTSSDDGEAPGRKSCDKTPRPTSMSTPGTARHSFVPEAHATEMPSSHQNVSAPVDIHSSPAMRPQRARQMPIRLADYVTKTVRPSQTCLVYYLTL